ncbi:MAG: hypothetical protein EHM35_02445 [Planctomycetaceae bacterium]|nr:MAG: hypothetical protein EHM35_02445 [Planctomycetaceae bacterium]
MTRLTLALTMLLLAVPALATVPSDSATTAGPYACDGSDTTFTFNFGIDATTDLQVIRITIATGAAETLSTGYSVTSANTNDPQNFTSGGTVTFTTAPAATYQIFLRRSTAKTQNLNVDDEDVEEAIDKLTRGWQEVVRDLGLCVKIQPNEAGDTVQLAPKGTAGYVYRAAGGNFSLATPIAGAVAMSAPWDDVVTGAGSNSNNLLVKADLNLDHVFDVRDYGTTDDTAAIQAAEAAADDAGGILFFPPGDYELTDDLTTSANVALQFAPGATISVATTKTLTINNPQNIVGTDPTQKLFVLNGTGRVVFTVGGEISANWWGLSTSESAANNATVMNEVLSVGFGYHCDVGIWGNETDTFPCGQVSYTNAGSVKAGIRILGRGNRATFDHSSLTGSQVAWSFVQTVTHAVEWSTVLDNIKLIGPEATLDADIAHFVDLGAGETRIDCVAAHGYSTSDVVRIAGTTNYNGVYTITQVDADSFKITHAFVADDAAGITNRSAWRSGWNSTTTKGLSAAWMLGLKLNNVEIKFFNTGFYATECYLRDTGCLFWACENGMILTDGCTVGYHQSTYDTNWNNVILQANAGGVYGQTFQNCLLQAAGNNAVTMDANTGFSIFGIALNDCYFESIGNTTGSLGRAIALGQTTAGVDRGGNVYGIEIRGGVWSAIYGSPVYGALTNGGQVHGVNISNITEIAQPSDIDGYLRNSVVMTTSAAGSTAVPDPVWFYDNSGAVHYPVLETDTILQVTKTKKITIGHVGETTTDFAWTTAANHTQQNLDLGAVIPAHARVLDVTIICTEALVGESDITIGAGNASAGAEFITGASCDALDDTVASAAGAAAFVAASNAAQHLWISGDPSDATWADQTAGTWLVAITYIDVAAVE